MAAKVASADEEQWQPPACLEEMSCEIVVEVSSFLAPAEIARLLAASSAMRAVEENAYYLNALKERAAMTSGISDVARRQRTDLEVLHRLHEIQLTGPRKLSCCFAVHIDTTAIAVAHGKLLLGRVDGMVSVWSRVEDNAWSRAYLLPGNGSRVTGIAVLPSGQIVVASCFPSLRVWAADLRTLDAELEGHNLSATALASIPRLGLIVTGSQGGTMLVWRTESWSIEHSLVVHESKQIVALCVSPSCEHVVSLGESGRVRVWDTVSWTTVRSFRVRSPSSGGAVFVGDSRIAVCYGRGWIKLLDCSTGNQRNDSPMRSGGDCMEDSHRSSENEHAVALFRGTKGERGPPSFYSVSAMHVVGEHLLISGTADGCLRVWDIRSWKCVRQLGPLVRSSEGTHKIVGLSGIATLGDVILCCDLAGHVFVFEA